jgi:hypothetical protein
MVAAFMLCTAPAGAGTGTDIIFTELPTQDQLDSLTRELGASLSQPALAPAEALGTAHVDAGLTAMATNIDASADYWKIASGDDSFSSYFVTPRAAVRVGLPWGIDIGGSYASVPSSNVDLLGGELKWAFVRGSTTVPAFAARLSHSRLRGVDQMDLDVTALDLSVSKGIAFITPYGGVGRLWVDSEVYDVDSAPGLTRDSSEQFTRIFAGARLAAGWFKTTLEAQRAGDVNSYSLRLAFLLP